MNTNIGADASYEADGDREYAPEAEVHSLNECALFAKQSVILFGEQVDFSQVLHTANVCGLDLSTGVGRTYAGAVDFVVGGVLHRLQWVAP